MDVYGKAPTDPKGEYFRNNVWWWRPLADYVCDIAPEITSACELWHSNDGDGLDAEASIQLADRLDAEIASGRTKEFQLGYERNRQAIPREKCELCGGTGIRTDSIGVEHGMPEMVIGPEETQYDIGKTVQPDHPRYGKKGWCNGCGGFEIC
jgi:hypothetical protein